MLDPVLLKAANSGQFGFSAQEVKVEERLAHLRVPQHDHSDQHDVDVNTQGLIMVNFIHLRKKRGKIKKKKTH